LKLTQESQKKKMAPGKTILCIWQVAIGGKIQKLQAE
jgi:hypothetical protein